MFDYSAAYYSAGPPRPSGRIIFSEAKNIFVQINHGSVSTIRIPEGTVVKRVSPHMYICYQCIVERSDPLDEAQFWRLIELGACVYINECAALYAASKLGYLEVVRYIVGTGAKTERAAIIACKNNHLAVVQLLVESGISMQNLLHTAASINSAIQNGWPAVFKG